VGFRDAAAFGIDNLEHGLAVDSEFYSHKQSGVCPDWGAAVGELIRMNARKRSRLRLRTAPGSFARTTSAR
jgi:hypothetical protein